MDIKLENVMIEDRKQLDNHPIWKIIDWDMYVRGGTVERDELLGTIGEMPPGKEDECFYFSV